MKTRAKSSYRRASVGSKSLQDALSNYSTQWRTVYGLRSGMTPSANAATLLPLLFILVEKIAVLKTLFDVEVSRFSGGEHVGFETVGITFPDLVASIASDSRPRVRIWAQSGIDIINFERRVNYYLSVCNECFAEGKALDPACTADTVTLPLLLGLRDRTNNDDPSCKGESGPTCASTIADVTTPFLILKYIGNLNDATSSSRAFRDALDAFLESVNEAPSTIKNAPADIIKATVEAAEEVGESIVKATVSSVSRAPVVAGGIVLGVVGLGVYLLSRGR